MFYWRALYFNPYQIVYKINRTLVGPEFEKTSLITGEVLTFENYIFKLLIAYLKMNQREKSIRFALEELDNFV